MARDKEWTPERPVYNSDEDKRAPKFLGGESDATKTRRRFKKGLLGAAALTTLYMAEKGCELASGVRDAVNNVGPAADRLADPDSITRPNHKAPEVRAFDRNAPGAWENRTKLEQEEAGAEKPAGKGPADKGGRG